MIAVACQLGDTHPHARRLVRPQANGGYCRNVTEAGRFIQICSQPQEGEGRRWPKRLEFAAFSGKKLTP
ncbi:hypothetical protein OCAR_5611 [Afipia carboxidovorans OM5]|nr:hypothetical protein OCAR_5611 [Afipia carboxidovorans OM5]